MSEPKEPMTMISVRVTQRQKAAYDEALTKVTDQSTSDHIRRLIQTFVTRMGVSWPPYHYERGVFKINRGTAKTVDTPE